MAVQGNFIDSLLNIVIPIGAILFFGFAAFKAFGPQIRHFVEWIKEMFSGETKQQKVDSFGGTIVYQ